MTRDELTAATELRLLAFPPSVAADVLDLFRQRQETILDQCRAAIRAEQDYQSAIHERVGSRYGAERRERFVEYARKRRDETARELGL